MRMWIIREILSLAIPLALAGCGESNSPADSQSDRPSLAPTPELKAAMEFGSASTLERSRKTKEAVSAYQRIVRQYPDTPQAKVAAERIGALGAGKK
jgi:hypothetical protein